MRSKPKKSNKGLVAAALISLAVIWLVFGTALLLGFRYWAANNSSANAGNDTVSEEPAAQEDAADDASGYDDPDQPDDSEDDVEDTDDSDFDDPDDVDDTDPDEDIDDDEDPDDDNDDVDDPDDDDDDPDDDDGSKTFTVDAWDGFAAVRTGRGTGYSQVGKLNNGEKVRVADLDDGWYRITSGKWKGYYLHQSSLRQ